MSALFHEHHLPLIVAQAAQTAFIKLFSLRADPFERADHESGSYERWRVDRAFVMVPAQAMVMQHLASYKEFAPRQKPGSFSLDHVMEKLQEGSK